MCMVPETFFEYLSYEKRYSTHTVEAYRTDLRQFSEFLSEAYELSNVKEVSYQVVRSWIVHLMGDDMSSRSVNRKISSLRTFFKFLRKEGEIELNPMQKIQGPKAEKRLPVFVDEPGMSNLFEVVEFQEDFKGQRDKLLMELFYATGVRVSELIEIRDTDVDQSNCTIKVLGKRNKERLVPVSIKFLQGLRAYIETRNMRNDLINSGYLLVDDEGKKLTRFFVYRLVKQYLSMVTTVTKKSPHVLRHTFATHMLNHGADLNAIKEILGHANLAATQVYTHNTIDQLKNIHKQAHPKG